MPSENIESGSYLLGVTKENRIKDIYTIFYNAIVNNVDDTHSTTRTIWWYPEHNEKNVINSEGYPIGTIVVDPDDTMKQTYGRLWMNGVVQITIFATDMSILDQITQDVMNSLDDMKDTFRRIKVDNVYLDTSNYDHFMRGEIRVNARELRYTFRLSYDRS